MGRLVTSVLVCALLCPAAVKAQDGRVKTVVVGLAARRGVDAGLALAMSDVVQGVYVEDKARLVLGREDIKRVLSFEEERAALGCDSASCLSEIASALDVDRLITGSIDKVGSSYFVVITEIDARTVEPLSRVQKRLPLDEDELVIGVQDLARELLSNSGKAPVRADGTAGAIMVSAEPSGAKVLVDGEEKGVTPMRVEGLAPGTHKLTVDAKGFEPVELDVPVYKDKVTEVGGGIGGGVITPAELKAYEDAVGDNAFWGWTKIISGAICGPALCCGAGALASQGFAGNVFGLTTISCIGLSGLGGLGVCGWGVFDLFTPPKKPGGSKHRLTIAPPPGEGEVEQVELDAVTEMPH
jgi:hypothetical protein